MKELAHAIVKVYQRKLEKYRKTYNILGYTVNSFNTDENTTFRLVVVTAYDQRPFTKWAGGWEPIWGLGRGQKLPKLLNAKNLWNVHEVRSLTKEEIRERLEDTHFYSHTLARYGSKDYASMFVKAANMTKEFQTSLLSAKSGSDAVILWHMLAKGPKKIPCIAETIASKIIMYTLREIGVGNVKPADFPIKIVKPLLGELHNTNAARVLGLTEPSIEDILRILKEEYGDPFAIDGLYYADREDPEAMRELRRAYQVI